MPTNELCLSEDNGKARALTKWGAAEAAYKGEAGDGNAHALAPLIRKASAAELSCHKVRKTVHKGEGGGGNAHPPGTLT